MRGAEGQDTDYDERWGMAETKRRQQWEDAGVEYFNYGGGKPFELRLGQKMPKEEGDEQPNFRKMYLSTAKPLDKRIRDGKSSCLNAAIKNNPGATVKHVLMVLRTAGL